MGRTVRAALAAVVAVGLAGCWPAPGQGPDRRSHNPSESTIDVASAPSLAVAWDTVVEPGAYAEERVSAPTVSSRAVHVTNERSVSYAVDRATGDLLWRYPAEDPIASHHLPSPVVKGDRVMHGAGWTWSEGGVWDSRAVWLDAATGAEREEVAAGPVTGRRGDRLVGWWHAGGQGAGYVVYGLVVTDEADPAASWSGTILFDWFAPQRPPTLGARRVYHSGTITESFLTPSVVGVHAFPLTRPATDCVAPHPDHPQLPAISCPLWTTPTASPPVTSPVIGPGEDVIHVGLEDGSLLALDAADGSERWRAALGARPSADPALADGRLFVPLANGTLAVVDAASGALAWTADVGGAGTQPAVAGRATPGADGVVLVGTDAGDLVALPAAGCGAATCSPIATVDLGAPVTGATAVTGGHAYVGVAPNRVVALAPSDD